MARSLGAAFVAAGVTMSVLTLFLSLDFSALTCLLVAGGLLVFLGIAVMLSPGPSVAYQSDITAADYALREKHETRKPR